LCGINNGYEKRQNDRMFPISAFVSPHEFTKNLGCVPPPLQVADRNFKRYFATVALTT